MTWPTRIHAFALAVAMVLSVSAGAHATPVTCTGDAPTEEVSPPRTTVRWGDMALGLIAVAVAVGGLLYVRTNERHRRARRIVATRLDSAPYATGAALGLLAATSLVAFRRPLGISGGIASIGAGTWTWGAWVVVGVFAGALGSAIAARRWRLRAIPENGWRERFGSQPALRWAIAFIGGVLIQYGAELAGGCTSGLAVSGGIVLAPGAFVFMAAMFAAGIPTARALAGRA